MTLAQWKLRRATPGANHLGHYTKKGTKKWSLKSQYLAAAVKASGTAEAPPSMAVLLPVVF
jgi:hypothetical protein